MINFTGIIKSTSINGGPARYINTDSIQRIAELDTGREYRTKIFYDDNSGEFSQIPAEIWAKAVLKADESDEIVDINQFAINEYETKLDIMG